MATTLPETLVVTASPLLVILTILLPLVAVNIGAQFRPDASYANESEPIAPDTPTWPDCSVVLDHNPLTLTTFPDILVVAATVPDMATTFPLIDVDTAFPLTVTAFPLILVVTAPATVTVPEIATISPLFVTRKTRLPDVAVNSGLHTRP